MSTSCCCFWICVLLLEHSLQAHGPINSTIFLIVHEMCTHQAFAVCVVTIEPRPLCKLTWFLFDRNYCLFYTKCRRLCSLLCTNISTPTKVETTMLSITHLTQDRRRRTSIRPYCARVLILGRVLGWGWDWETENSWAYNDNCRWLCENIRLPNLLNKAWKYIFLVLW